MAYDGPDLAMALCCIIVAIGGLFANGLLVFLITFSKDLRRKDYIWFILNRALMDLCNCIVLGAMQPIAILLTDSDSNTCVAVGYLELVLGLGAIYAEPFLACNRYISLLRSDQYEKVYKQRNVYLLCAASWMLGVISNLPHIFLKSLGRETGSFCSLILSQDTLLQIYLSNYTFVFAGLGAIMFFNWKIYRYLKLYQAQPMTNSQRTQLQTDRELLRFIFVATFLPMLFQTPGIIVAWTQMVHKLSGWIVFAGMGFYTTSLVAGPVITILMVRPIRRQLLKRLGRQVMTSSIQVEPIGKSVQGGVSVVDG